jgi:5-(carboxyamino)imidazole ribonucleotide mutase
MERIETNKQPDGLRASKVRARLQVAAGSERGSLAISIAQHHIFRRSYMMKTPKSKNDVKQTANKTLVGILTGSPNDLPTVVKARDTLTELGIASEIIVASAHRTPDKVLAYLDRAHQEGVQVLIGCAGVAAHLAGVIAGRTRLPVIGLPLSGGVMSGLDALLSTVQMPPGVPVATVAVDGAKNAALLAARILALKYPEIDGALEAATRKERARYEQSAAAALVGLVNK